jgi:hypothetical protein
MPMGGRKASVVALVAMAACGHAASPPMVTAPSQETAAPSSAPAVSVVPTASAPHPETPNEEPVVWPTAPLPQSDPIPPPAPRCPNVGALVSASAIVKRESASRARPAKSPDILDIELTVTLPANPEHVTLAPNHLTVAGGVIVKQSLQAEGRTKAVVLIRPSGTVAREGSLLALFGVTCAVGEGNVRVDMTFALPSHDGDKVTIRRVDGY